MSKGSVSISSYVRVVRSILTIVITLSLFTASVPVSTYAAIQAPPPRKYYCYPHYAAHLSFLLSPAFVCRHVNEWF
jgi:hypothetical protein